MAVSTHSTNSVKRVMSSTSNRPKKLAAKDAKKQPILIPKQFDQVKLKKACKSLLIHAQKEFLEQSSRRTQKKPVLLPGQVEPASNERVEGLPIYLEINTFESVTGSTEKSSRPDPTLIPVPHRVRPKASELSICMIVDNPQTKYINILVGANENAPAEDKPVTHDLFAEIVSTSKLRSRFSKASIHQHKAAIEFVKNFDLIVYDGNRISAAALKSILGPKVVYKPAGPALQSPLPITFQPVPGSDATPAEMARVVAVVADPAVIRRQIKYIASCVVAAPAPGNSLSVLVGLSSHSREQLITNIAAVLRIVLDSRKPLIVGGWDNVRNMVIKTSESAGLPLYTAPTRSRDTENEL
jgi:hypothetical protein